MEQLMLIAFVAANLVVIVKISIDMQRLKERVDTLSDMMNVVTLFSHGMRQAGLRSGAVTRSGGFVSTESPTKTYSVEESIIQELLEELHSQYGQKGS